MFHRLLPIGLLAGCSALALADDFASLDEALPAGIDIVSTHPVFDFDGDGTWDLTTKSDRVTHVYTDPNEF